jgi:hypothetical protein
VHRRVFAGRSCSQVYAWLLLLFTMLGGVPGVLAYDDACHLIKFIMNAVRFDLKNVNCMQRLLARFTQLCVDPFHFGGHKKTDAFCQEHMDPKKLALAKDVNMEVRRARRCR